MGRARVTDRARLRRGIAAACVCGLLAAGASASAHVSAAPRHRSPRPAGTAIDSSDRQSVAKAYRTRLVPALSTPAAYSGDPSTCTPGTESDASRKATFRAINFYRELAGLEPVVNEPAWAPAQMELALMSHAEGNISHFPTPDWECYTAAAAAAALRSNLAAGIAGAGAVDAYMDDFGNPSAGHRRGILFPPATRMATGSTTAYNALRTIDDVFQPRPSKPEWVAWPPAGYVPWPVVPTSGNARLFQWSLSSNAFPDANYHDAHVVVRMGDEKLIVDVLPVEDPYNDNTIVWNARRSGDKPFPRHGVTELTVKVSGITGVPGSPISRRYTVRAFPVG